MHLQGNGSSSEGKLDLDYKIMCFLQCFCCMLNNRKKRSTNKEKKLENDAESEKFTEKNKLKGRRKALCELSALDREVLVLQLENYVRMHRLDAYGIMVHGEKQESSYIHHITGPQMGSSSQITPSSES